MFYLTKHSTHFYLLTYGFGHVIVKDHLNRHIQFTLCMLGMQCVVSWCGLSWSAQTAIRRREWSIRWYVAYSLIFLTLIYALFTLVIIN